MPAKLIINADDFGLTHGINRAVHELTQSGALTSATLMAHSAAFDQAVAFSKALPELGVGCHVVLTDGVPVSSPDTIPTLMGSDGRSFRTSLQSFWLAVLLGRVRAEDIERECEAQVQKLRRTGLRLTHLDTHKHTHILPAVARSLLRVAERTGVRAVRNPFEHAWSLKLTHGSFKRQLQVSLMSALRKQFQALPQIRNGSVMTTDGTIGISATGNLDARMLDKLLRHLPDGVWELVTHPGYHDHELDAIKTRLKRTRDVEREALLSAFAETSSHRFPVELIHYGMLLGVDTSNTAIPASESTQTGKLMQS